MTLRKTWIVAMILISLRLWISASEKIGGWVGIE